MDQHVATGTYNFIPGGGGLKSLYSDLTELFGTFFLWISVGGSAGTVDTLRYAPA